MSVGKKSKAQVNKVRSELFQRDNETCVVQGSEWAIAYPCFGDLTVQHGVGRGMGSSAKYDGIDFLRTMCAGHNGMETSHPFFAAACHRNGWSIERWVADRYGAKSIPVLYHDGWHLLQNGSRLPISEATANAIWDDLHDIFEL
jgi:hypothetical protein